MTTQCAEIRGGGEWTSMQDRRNQASSAVFESLGEITSTTSACVCVCEGGVAGTTGGERESATFYY